MKPGDKYWSVVEAYWDAISIHDGADTFLSHYSRAPVKARLLFAAHWCQSEIRNGGLKQFFMNSTGMLAPEAIEGFSAIGMSRAAKVIQESIDLFGSPYPREKAQRVKVMRGPSKVNVASRLSALEEKFFECLYSENGGFERAADGYAK